MSFKKTLFERSSIFSLKMAVKEQRFADLYSKLKLAVPDISNQYTTRKVDSEYLDTKIRAQHSFQISLVNKAMEMTNAKKHGRELKIVDIGDSAGTHIQYIKNLYPEKNISTLSVNTDQKAVDRIKAKGLEAVCSSAEDIKTYESSGEKIFLSFEMLEHLINPIKFLRSLSENANCSYFVITVPYLAQSRVGLHHIRNNNKVDFNAENAHILELSPDDWRLLFKLTGWRVEYEKVYLQYPRFTPFYNILKWCWRKFDFEGFYGAVLVKDSTWSRLYKNEEVLDVRT